MVVVKHGGGFTISTINFDGDSQNQYQAEYILKTEEEDELTPLVLKIDSATKYLSYNWSQSEDNIPFVTKEYPLKPGNDFPNLQIETEKGDLNISDFSGKVIVINWWATTCIPCIQEIPGLNELVKKYEDEQILFLAILYDKENFPKFRENHDFNYLHGFSSEKVFETLGGTFPRNVIIDTKGVIVYNKTGGSKDTSKDLDKMIQSLL